MAHLQSGFTTTVRVNGEDLGEFKTFSGGQVRSEVVADRAPGQRFASQTPGLPTIEPITVGRTFKRERDTPALIARLRNAIQVEDACTVTQWSLDGNGQPYDKIGTWVGALSEVNPPEQDAMSNDLASFELVIAPSGVS